MPPFGFRKRERSSSPAPAPHKKRKTAAPSAKKSPKKGKPTLFDTADEPSKRKQTIQESRKFLDDLDDAEESSLSDVDSDDFEDVPPAKRRKIAASKDNVKTEAEDEEDEMDWEDAIQDASSSAHRTPSALKVDDDIGDISVSVNEDGTYIQPLVSAATGKKGPSKRERQIRVQTHCLHVMALMWHNTVRNSWLNDKQVQKILVDGLTDGVQKEVKRWQEVMRSVNGEQVKEVEKPKNTKSKGKQLKKAKKSEGRDWNPTAESQATGNEKASIALLRLLKVLTSYWRKRFTITAPGIRKLGYKDLRRLRNDIKAWEKDHNDAEEHGERIQSRIEFRKLARNCEGSRDVGGQLFVALLRGVGLEVRMVTNLQPAGIGWSKAEEANEKKDKKSQTKKASIEQDSDIEAEESIPKSASTKKKMKPDVKPEKPKRKSTRGSKVEPIDLDDSDSPLSSAPSVEEYDNDEDDLESIIDVTPVSKKFGKKYDRDMAFPNYWTEVLDPVSQKWIPVDPIVLSTIASSEELLQSFEPRGKKAERAKQVMCYTIAYCADGSAKDVTIRYLKRHQLPGKTKGVRMPAEKIPIYNRRGKVKKYEDYDWFRTLMLVYDRPESKRTAADDLEESTDLKPFKPAKQEKIVERESLQGYKQSADYVLEQHLRREEALLSGVKPVKTFITGKGDKGKEYDVYLRSDVVVCKTVESWHKEGRAIKFGEQPLKYVPMRAVTLIKKREMEDAERETGEKLKQGLYSEAQTDWIIPPPIQNGVIPKNAFGNMDVYVPTMVPEGAVHLPLKGTAKICRKLDIDHAEACTGFEFGKQRAVPVLTGVVVAKENEKLVRDAWKVQREEEKRKEDTKRTATALHWWRKMLLGLRVLERMRVEYADADGGGEEVNPFVKRAEREGRAPAAAADGDKAGEGQNDGGGGFLLSDDEDEAEEPEMTNAGGGFLVDDDDVTGAGGIVQDDSSTMPNGPSKSYAPITPVSLQSMHKATNGGEDSEIESEDEHTKSSRKAKGQSNIAASKPTSKRSGARKKILLSESEDEDSLTDLSSASENDSNDSEDDSDHDALPTPPPPITSARHKKAKQTSPQVMISPEKKTSTPAAGSSKARSAKKVTPVRSQYFDHSAAKDDEEMSTDDAEVVKPRRTTARTRSRG